MKPVVLHRAGGAPVSTTFRKTGSGGADPFARQREIAWDGPDSMIVGRTSFIGELDVQSFPHVETIVVVEGEVTLASPGNDPLVLRPNMGAVIGCGTSLRMTAASRAKWTFCAAACDKPTKRGISLLRAEANFKPSNSLPPEVLLGPPPVCRSDNVFTEDAAQFQSGTWDSTPYHRVVRVHGKNEFMHLVAGGVRFASPDGEVLSLAAGDSLFVPQGTPVGWESSERVAKFYAVQTARS